MNEFIVDNTLDDQFIIVSNYTFLFIRLCDEMNVMKDKKT